MKKIYKKDIFIIFILLILVSCKNEPDKVNNKINKNEIIVSVTTEPENGFDPTLNAGHGYSPLIQSTLVEYTHEMKIKNDLATDYSISDDGLTWQFTLRDDAFFTDGEKVKPLDVAFTFNKSKTSQTTLDLTFMDKCEAINDKVVEFKLNKPTSTFIYTIATTGIVPEHLYNDDYADNPIGSGPWEFVQWNKGEEIILKANENYYGEVPKIKKVVIVFMDEDISFASVQSKKVDVGLVSPIQATKEIDGYKIFNISTVDNRGLTLPISKNLGEVSEDGYPIGNDVTENKAIREALAHCMNREEIAKNAVNGFADPAFSENDGLLWNNPGTKIIEDKAKAKEILKNDGWVMNESDGILEKNGLRASFACIYPSGDSARQSIAMAAASQAKEVGIEIKVEGISWDEISKRMFQDSVLMGWGSINPYSTYLLYHSSNKLKADYYNPEGFDNPVVDKYLNSAMEALTAEDANEYWKLAQWDDETGSSMKGDIPWVWLINLQHIYYVRDGLDIGNQKLHAHGASWSLLQNLAEWKWD